MTTWFRSYDEDEDLWLYFEVDDEGWAVRQAEVRRVDARPVTAASQEEVLYLREHAEIAAMVRYEEQYGILSELPLEDWQDEPGVVEVSPEEFERLWAEARRVLGDAPRSG
ncbi:hypothetical protein [Streptomyces sp. UNOC14_S4]|uniref:hypothetical protein n=1 Tax=Streptomyces sp. UNOC14_S4 TaxID=2872340 RepID=UPI001E5E9D5D|nr:hypothetical protein [Streptomyces sp. UNOC14_S4]MCC3772641.1 hypothetical protein [Streptomyces sp. UNOC14_S4]